LMLVHTRLVQVPVENVRVVEAAVHSTAPDKWTAATSKRGHSSVPCEAASCLGRCNQRPDPGDAPRGAGGHPRKKVERQQSGRRDAQADFHSVLRLTGFRTFAPARCPWRTPRSPAVKSQSMTLVCLYCFGRARRKVRSISSAAAANEP
jgi:hypothetical protein